MSVRGVGFVDLPLYIVVGGDQPAGEISLPLFIVGGVGGSYDNFLELPSLVVSGSGSAPFTEGVISLPLPVCSGSGDYPLRRGTGRLILPVPIVTGLDSIRGSGSIILPIPVVFPIPPYSGLGQLTLPVPDYIGFARSVHVSRIYKGITMNLANQAISTHNIYPFNSLAYLRGQLYGANEQGIYRFHEGKGNVGRIESKIKTGMLDLGEHFIKYLRGVWLTYRSDGNLVLAFATQEDEGDRTEGFPTTIAGNDIHEEYIAGPRGLRGRYYIIELKNLSGADFDIEKISIIIDAIRKRIR